MEYVLALLVSAGVFLAFRFGRDRIARRRVRKLGTGRVSVPVRLRGADAPYPPRFRRGRIVSVPGETTHWLSYWPPFVRVDLGDGAVREVSRRRQLDDDLDHVTYSRLRDRQGVVLDLRCQERHEDGLAAMLHAARIDGLSDGTAERSGPERTADGGYRFEDLPDTARSPVDPVPADNSLFRRLRHRTTVWGAIFGAAFALLLVVTFWLFALGRVTEGVVTSAADADLMCGVRWTDPWDGTTRTTTVDCDSEQPGDPITLIATVWPLEHDAGSLDWTLWPLVIGLSVTGAGAATGVLWARRRNAVTAVRRRLEADPPTWSQLRDSTYGTELPASLTFDATAAVAERRAVIESWRDPGTPHLLDVFRGGGGKADDAWWRVPSLRNPALIGVAVAALQLAFVGLFGSAFVDWAIATRRLDGPDTQVAEAMVLQIDDISGGRGDFLRPDYAELQYVVDGITYTIWLDVERSVNEGDVVAVRYDVTDPTHALPVDDPNRTFAPLMGIAAVGIAAFGVWGASRRVRRFRGMRAAVRSPGIPVSYVLLPGPEDDGTAAVVWTAAKMTPACVVLTAEHDLLSTVPVSGSAEMRPGALIGKPAALVIGDRVLWGGRTQAPETDEIRALLDPFPGAGID